MRSYPRQSLVDIVGYTYEADWHCPECARARADRGGFLIDEEALAEARAADPRGDTHDEHGVPVFAVDWEGNPVTPVFAYSELPCDVPGEYGGYRPVACGDCGDVVKHGRAFYYRCGCCDQYHADGFSGDCREDAARFTMDDLDDKHGPFGWDEFEPPEYVRERAG